MESYAQGLSASIYLSFCPAEVKDQSPHSFFAFSPVSYLSATLCFQMVERIDTA